MPNGIGDLLAVTQFEQQQEMQANPLFALTQGIAAGIQQQREQTQRLNKLNQLKDLFFDANAGMSANNTGVGKLETGDFMVKAKLDLISGKPTAELVQRTPQEKKAAFEFRTQKSVQDNIGKFIRGEIDQQQLSQTPGISEGDFRFALERRQMTVPRGVAAQQPIPRAPAVPAQTQAQQDIVVTELDPLTGLPAKAESISAIQQKETAKKRATEASKAREAISQATLIQQDLNDVFDDFLKIPENIRGPVAGRTVGPAERLAQTPGGGEAAQLYEDSINFFLSNLARSLGGERGVLTDRDIARVRALMPQLRDRDTLARSKIDRVNDFIQRRIDEARKKTGEATTNQLETPSGISFTFEEIK